MQMCYLFPSLRQYQCNDNFTQQGSYQNLYFLNLISHFLRTIGNTLYHSENNVIFSSSHLNSLLSYINIVPITNLFPNITCQNSTEFDKMRYQKKNNKKVRNKLLNSTVYFSNVDCEAITARITLKL